MARPQRILRSRQDAHGGLERAPFRARRVQGGHGLAAPARARRVGEHEVPPERLDRRGHRRAAPAHPRLDRRAARRGPGPAGARRARRDPPLLYREVLDEAYAHQDAGRRVYIVTAASQELADVLAHVLVLDGGVGMRSEVRDGVYTGRPAGPFTYREGKAEAIRELAAREGIDLSESYAYSDSESDLPMMRAGGPPRGREPRPRARARGARGGLADHALRQARARASGGRPPWAAWRWWAAGAATWLRTRAQAAPPHGSVAAASRRRSRARTRLFPAAWSASPVEARTVGAVPAHAQPPGDEEHVVPGTSCEHRAPHRAATPPRSAAGARPSTPSCSGQTRPKKRTRAARAVGVRSEA